METMRGWGKDAKRLVCELRRWIKDCDGDAAGLYFVKRLSIAIQRGNVVSVTEALAPGSVIGENNLAPILKKSAGSTGKSGASLLGKSSGSKPEAFGSSGKSTFGSSSNKSSNLGSTASKLSNFGSTASKSSNFGYTPSKSSNLSPTPIKTSTFGSTASKTSTFGAITPKDKDSSSRGPSFLVAGGKFPSGLTPSTSRKTYETAYYNPKSSKSSTSLGIIWLPGRKRNKKKEMAFSAINNDKRNERAPTLNNIMSGDSPDHQLNKKKDEERNLLVPEKIKGPIATAASAGAATVISGAPSDLSTDPEDKLLSHDKEETKDAAGDGNIKEKDDTDYLENDAVVKTPESKHKSSDKVDSVFISPPSGIKSPPPPSATSNPDEDDCIIKCLYYTLQCCDCSIM